MTASEPTRWCPRCGAEYRAGFSECADCGVALVTEPPPSPSRRPTIDESAGHEPVGYDLADWDAESRAALEWMLGGRNIPFEWGEDGILLVPPALANDVEGFLDYIESGEANAGDGDADDDLSDAPAEAEGEAPSPWWPS